MTLTSLAPRGLLLAMLAVGLVFLAAQARAAEADDPAAAPARWKALLAQRLPAYGHRNWIVVADAAYPSQSGQGIETVATGADHMEVLRAVLDALGKCKHVRPVVYLDAELPHVPEDDAPGINRAREQLKRVLADRPVTSLPHEKIIDKLDKAGKTFNVLILKTNLAVPYTSVFMELDCGYWGPDAEKRLRDKLGSK